MSSFLDIIKNNQKSNLKLEWDEDESPSSLLFQKSSPEKEKESNILLGDFDLSQLKDIQQESQSLSLELPDLSIPVFPTSNSSSINNRIDEISKRIENIENSISKISLECIAEYVQKEIEKNRPKPLILKDDEMVIISNNSPFNSFGELSKEELSELLDTGTFFYSTHNINAVSVGVETMREKNIAMKKEDELERNNRLDIENN